MVASDPDVVLASAARTTSGNSGSIAGFGGEFVTLGVHVTAASGGTPSLALTIRWSHDGGATFGDPDGGAETFVAITAAKETYKRVAVLAPHMRIDWAITGTTPSFTFSVTAF